MSNPANPPNYPGAHPPQRVILKGLEKIQELHEELRLGLPPLFQNYEGVIQRGLRDRYRKSEAVRDKAAALRARLERKIHLAPARSARGFGTRNVL